MPTVEKIDESRFPLAYELLLDLNNHHITEVEWRNLFNYKWEKDEKHCGYALVEDGKIVGFIGMIFRSRVIGKKVEKFCNISSWIVKEKYRAKSLLLVMPLSKMRNYTITDLSPTRKVSLILKRLGFKELDSQLRILVPLGMIRKKAEYNGVHISEDQAIMESRLQDTDLRIFDDHRDYKCSHLLMYGKDEYCYVVYTRVKRHMIPYCCIQYISNREMFGRYNKHIRGELLRQSRTLFIVVDSRLVRDKDFRFSAELSLRTPKLYRSANMRPEEVDNLYSEAVLLNAGTAPHALRLIWALWKRIWLKGYRRVGSGLWG